MSAPKEYCAKMVTEEGKEQVYGFYVLEDTEDENGKAIKARRYSIRLPKSQLQKGVTEMSKKLAMITKLEEAEL